MAQATLDDRGVKVSCPSCGKTNRLGYAALGRTTRCGHCQTTLSAPGVPVDAPTDAAFDAAAASSTLPLIVDFWAPWCGPCRMVAPELERVAASVSGRFIVVKVNTDQLTQVAARYRIQSIPTLAIVHGGRELARIAGARPAADIEAFAVQTVASSTRRAS